jgi:exodeoxyribonuclease V alpha subunit
MVEIVWDAKQREAIEACCDIKRRVVAVTGKAGTGKTRLLLAVYTALTAAGYRVVLCSTTGKAAKRIFEATGIEALTIHRLLEYSHPGEPDPKTGKPRFESFPKRDRSNPIEYDVVLADEYAMVNHETHRNLFDAIPAGGAIRVFGDINQLKPVEESKKLQTEPSPFQILLTKFSGIVLETIHRQDEGSGIITNADRILRRRAPTRFPDCDLKITDRPIDTIIEYVLDKLDNNIDFSKPENQIITQQKNSWIGTVKLNQQMQNIFRPESDGWVHLPRHDWAKDVNMRVRIGDKVIITKNNYDLKVYNGETGIVIECSEYGEVVIDLGDREAVIPPILPVINSYGKTVEIDPRKDVDLAYALTTHKVQGSEYNHIIYILNKSTSFMQGRSNFYTGLTRAKKHAMIITDQFSLAKSVTSE